MDPIAVVRVWAAAQAYQLLQSEPPHILISDIGMPEEDGYELLRRVRALPPQQGGETFGERFSLEYVDALADIVTNLTLVPPPWRQFLIVDASAISAEDMGVLAAIRGAGWPGMAVVVGDASKAMQRSLGIDVVLPRTLDCELLRNTLKQLGSDRATIPMRRIAR